MSRKPEKIDVRICPTCARPWNGRVTILELAEAIDEAWDLLRMKLRTVFGVQP